MSMSARSSYVTGGLFTWERTKADKSPGASEESVRLQGLPALGLEREAMRSILMEVAELAAYSSVVMGELPRMTRAEAEDLLGEAGMLGTLQPELPSGSFTSEASGYMLTCSIFYHPVGLSAWHCDSHGVVWPPL